MSYTGTRSVAVGGLSQVTEVVLRNYSNDEGTQTPAEDTAGSVPFTLHFDCQEDLLALLMADPPTKPSADTETDTVALSTGHRLGTENADPEMLRSQSIAELKQQLSALSINAEDELFKSAPLNVGKYVVGPVPGASATNEPGEVDALTAGLDIVALNEHDIAAFKGVAAGSEGLKVAHGAGTPASPGPMDAETHDDVIKDINTNTDQNDEGVDEIINANDDTDIHPVADADVNATMDENVREDVDENIDEGPDENNNEHLVENCNGNGVETVAAENVADKSTAPRVPPNTPEAQERIWWENEFVVIKKSKLGGLGSFAAKDLKYGEKILEEMPILRTNNWGICNEYDALSDEDRELFHSLHQFSSNPNAHEIEKIRRANSASKAQVREADVFQLPKGVAIYSVTSRFNHACLPARNVHYVIDGNGDGKITLSAIKTIPKGTELTICYGGKPEQLLRGFGFRCECGGCVPLTDKQAEDIMKAWRGDTNWTNKW